jgi:hypothetical protein
LIAYDRWRFRHLLFSGNSTLSQSVFETSSQYFSPSDLTIFQNDYDLTVQAAEAINGFSTSQPCSGTINCDEGNLDVQYIMGVAQKVATIYWYVSSGNAFTAWVTDIADETDPPQSNSMSWGSIEQV